MPHGPRYYGPAEACRIVLTQEESTVHRKVTFFLAVTLVLSLFTVACELTVLASVRAPAHPLLAATGASPQAPADQIHPEARTADAVDGPTCLASCKAMALGARPAGRVSALAVPERKISLGQVTILGQALERGAYDQSTTPTGFESALAGVELPIRGKIPTFLLATVMLLVTVQVARRSEPPTGEAIATVSAPCSRALPNTSQHRPWRPWFDPRVLTLVDRAADWERVRLVPT